MKCEYHGVQHRIYAEVKRPRESGEIRNEETGKNRFLASLLALEST